MNWVVKAAFLGWKEHRSQADHRAAVQELFDWTNALISLNSVSYFLFVELHTTKWR